MAYLYDISGDAFETMALFKGTCADASLTLRHDLGVFVLDGGTWQGYGTSLMDALEQLADFMDEPVMDLYGAVSRFARMVAPELSNHEIMRIRKGIQP